MSFHLKTPAAWIPTVMHIEKLSGGGYCIAGEALNPDEAATMALSATWDGSSTEAKDIKLTPPPSGNYQNRFLKCWGRNTSIFYAEEVDTQAPQALSQTLAYLTEVKEKNHTKRTLLPNHSDRNEISGSTSGKDVATLLISHQNRPDSSKNESMSIATISSDGKIINNRHIANGAFLRDTEVSQTQNGWLISGPFRKNSADDVTWSAAAISSAGNYRWSKKIQDNFEKNASRWLPSGLFLAQRTGAGIRVTTISEDGQSHLKPEVIATESTPIAISASGIIYTISNDEKTIGSLDPSKNIKPTSRSTDRDTSKIPAEDGIFLTRNNPKQKFNIDITHITDEQPLNRVH